MRYSKIRLYSAANPQKVACEAVHNLVTDKYDLFYIHNGDISKKRLVKRGVTSKQITKMKNSTKDGKKNFSGCVYC